MEPKEKADELIGKFAKIEIEIGGQYDGYIAISLREAKECAIIVCVEVLDELPRTLLDEQETYKFWEDVKSEVEKC